MTTNLKSDIIYYINHKCEGKLANIIENIATLSDAEHVVIDLFATCLNTNYCDIVKLNAETNKVLLINRYTYSEYWDCVVRKNIFSEC